MRISAFAGLFVGVIIITLAGSSKASAETLGLLQLHLDDKSETTTSQPADLSPIEKVDAVLAEAAAEQAKKAELEVQKYIVAENDSLEDIAEAHSTTWKRLFDKNETIPHPDLLKPGDELVIPRADEVLTDRPLPAPTPEPVAVPITPASTRPTVRRSAPARAAVRQTIQARGTSAGNRYVAGYCTWYAKNRRPDLPNNLGNANTWVSRASAQGIPTGSAPRVGAIGQHGMHVVYVEAVNGDGTVTVSEMNYAGRYVISSRTVPAGYFMYIY